MSKYLQCRMIMSNYYAPIKNKTFLSIRGYVSPRLLSQASSVVWWEALLPQWRPRLAASLPYQQLASRMAPMITMPTEWREGMESLAREFLSCKSGTSSSSHLCLLSSGQYPVTRPHQASTENIEDSHSMFPEEGTEAVEN